MSSTPFAEARGQSGRLLTPEGMSGNHHQAPAAMGDEGKAEVEQEPNQEPVQAGRSEVSNLRRSFRRAQLSQSKRVQV